METIGEGREKQEQGTMISERFCSKQLSDEQKNGCKLIVQQCSILEAVLNGVDMHHNYRQEALFDLEKVAMLAVKGISRFEKPINDKAFTKELIDFFDKPAVPVEG